MMLWLNGALAEESLARIDPTDRGFTLGDGLFETIRRQGGRILHLDRHLARLRHGAGFLGIPLTWQDGALAAGAAALIEADRLGDAVLRLTLTRGPGQRGILPPAEPRPTLLITAAALPAPMPPARAIIATVTRRNEASPLSRFKTLNYLDNIIARGEALRRGADDAILLNTQGRVAEASVANVFALHGGRLLTPPVEDGALPGIMRGLLIERCGAVEAPLVPADLAAADAVFLSSSLGLRPVLTIDGYAIGGERGLAAVAGLAALAAG